MKYEEFLELIKKKAHQELGYPKDQIKYYEKGFTSDNPQMAEWIRDCNMRFMDKEGSELLTDFLVLETKECNNSKQLQRIAIRRLYEDYLEKGFDSAYKQISQSKNDIDLAQIDMDRIEKRLSTSYKEIRGQLIVRPLNYSLHIRDLKGCVYKKISDFVLALYQVLSDTGSSFATSKIRRDELKKWGMEEQEEKVIEDALENTARLYPACVYDKRIGCEVDFLKTDISRDDITFFSDHILLSTFRTTNGATALFYPGVREKMMDIMGGAFVAVFMNTNDVMIFDKKDPAAYRFLETAKHSSDIGEMLSGRLYLCEGNDIAAGYVVKIYEDGEATVE